MYLPKGIYEIKPFALIGLAGYAKLSFPENWLLSLSVVTLAILGGLILFLRYESRYTKPTK